MSDASLPHCDECGEPEYACQCEIFPDALSRLASATSLTAFQLGTTFETVTFLTISTKETTDG